MRQETDQMKRDEKSQNKVIKEGKGREERQEDTKRRHETRREETGRGDERFKHNFIEYNFPSVYHY